MCLSKLIKLHNWKSKSLNGSEGRVLDNSSSLMLCFSVNEAKEIKSHYWLKWDKRKINFYVQAKGRLWIE